MGIVAAEDLPFASHAAWLLGLAAAVPWPAAVAVEGLRQRRTTAAAHREIVKAERDLARQDYAESVKDFDRAIALGGKGTPGEELPWYGKGASLILLGRYEEALRAIDKALDLNPHNEVAWLNKGNALTKMGRLIDALRCFNAAIKVNPAYEVAWNNKGNTLARLGHHEEALACYERALEIDPDYRGAWVNKGYVLTKLGRYDEATSCADRVLRLNERPRSRVA
jgi:tetratricopeptide (TPR) repeat protein